MYEQRQFMIFNISELETINFSEVLETSEETLRKSLDGTKTFVKWESQGIPESVQNLTTKEGPYTYSEILEFLSGPEWIEEIIIDPTSIIEEEPYIPYEPDMPDDLFLDGIDM